MDKNKRAVVIGISAGGLQMLSKILLTLKKKFTFPLLIVQHLHKSQVHFMYEFLNKKSALILKEADEKEKIKPGHAYFAPANYHMLIENDETISLSVDPKVNFSRPSIDVLFESAADVYKDELVGILLTGANNDGAAGIKKIKEHGGITIAQDPEEAQFPVMPQSAICTGKVDYILKIEEIINFLNHLTIERT
jgi:two-component system, chemotaxis family, protein-glutamate methylesterase/glutaminase